jgi:hypothetical protein
MTMAGSYEHIKRDPNSHTGISTLNIENMGDATEAMTHMWWMIQILAGSNEAKIKDASRTAIEVEMNFTRPDGATQRRLADAESPGKPPQAAGWQPTMNLRFIKRRVPVLRSNPTAVTTRFILQQGFENAVGKREWVDVPTVEEA